MTTRTLAREERWEASRRGESSTQRYWMPSWQGGGVNFNEDCDFHEEDDDDNKDKDDNYNNYLIFDATTNLVVYSNNLPSETLRR